MASAKTGGFGRVAPTVPDLQSPHAGAVLASGLRHSRMFAIAVALYRRHRPDGGGQCPHCGPDLCRTRVHAAKIITAANEDPHAFDAPQHIADSRRPAVPDALTHHVVDR
jgi:hypothetical protein